MTPFDPRGPQVTQLFKDQKAVEVTVLTNQNIPVHLSRSQVGQKVSRTFAKRANKTANKISKIEFSALLRQALTRIHIQKKPVMKKNMFHRVIRLRKFLVIFIRIIFTTITISITKFKSHPMVTPPYCRPLSIIYRIATFKRTEVSKGHRVIIYLTDNLRLILYNL